MLVNKIEYEDKCERKALPVRRFICRGRIGNTLVVSLYLVHKYPHRLEGLKDTQNIK